MVSSTLPDLTSIKRKDHVGGMNTMAAKGNLDTKHALDLRNCRLGQDGAISKRGGLVPLSSNEFTGGASRLLKVVEFLRPDGEVEILAYGNTRLCRLENPYSGSGSWTTIKSGLLDDTPITVSTFNSKLIIAQQGLQTFKYFYITTPLRPKDDSSYDEITLTFEEVTSGALGARSYYVKWSKETANGETLASDELLVNVSANNVLKTIFPATAKGSVTASGTLTFSDTAALFRTAGVRIGAIVKNITDGSQAVVTAVTATELTTTALSGGTDDLWELGDTYKVYNTEGLSGWNIYISTTSGDQTKQNASLTDIGDDWQEPDSGLISGDALPTSSGAWVALDLASQLKDIKGGIVYTYNHRVFIAGLVDGRMKVLYCAVDNEDDWTTLRDAGYLELSTVFNESDEITAIRAFMRYLTFFGKNNLLMYSFPTDPSGIALVHSVPGTGAYSQDAVASVDEDLLIVTSKGIQSLRQIVMTQDITFKPVSKNITNQIVADLKSATDDKLISLINVPIKFLAMVVIPTSATATKTWIGNYNFKKKDKQYSWSYDTFEDSGGDPNSYAWCYAFTRDKRLLSGGNGYVYQHENDLSDNAIFSDDGNDVDFIWETPWDYCKAELIIKHFRYFLMKVNGTSFFYIDVYFDYSDTISYTLQFQPHASLWDDPDTLWDVALWDYPDISASLLPMEGAGDVIKLKFRAKTKGSLTLSHYGYRLGLGGYRG